ncbi:MAG: hypothetical protein AAFZ18_04635 [Myxococcota bacterium]
MGLLTLFAGLLAACVSPTTHGTLERANDLPLAAALSPLSPTPAGQARVCERRRPPGSRIFRRVCVSAARRHAEREAARRFFDPSRRGTIEQNAVFDPIANSISHF